MQLNAVGSTISFVQDGVTRLTATDTSVTGGAPGIMTYGQAKADNWAGAGATGGTNPTYSVGGSVSGLSGTVVLRDNGGDDLTVTANGSFAFATKLAGGAAYAVTVKTNPSGQSCSVANGSGTIGAADVTQRGRQLRRQPDLLGRRQHLRALRDGRAAGQRRRRPDPDRQRPLQLRDQARRRRRLRRHRQDEPERPELQRRQRQRHDRRRRRHERRRQLRRQPDLRGRRQRLLLSGTVVLQDNGGDDLSVSTNGPFNFATKLAGGAAYNVTVKTNPSGQTCSVANGSGTIAAADVTNVAVTCAATGSAGSDDFNRPDGSLGSNWIAMSDGALSIASQAVLGTSATAGDIRIAETYTSDQSSQIQLTSTQLSGGQWVGPTVRTQNGGQNTYLGIYFWNSGSPELRLYKRNAGTWIQLGSSYNSGPLAAGTTLQLNAVGSTISFLQDGVTRITATDTSVTGGAPGIMTYGQAKADNWAGAGATGGTTRPTRSAAASPGSPGRSCSATTAATT